MVSYSYMELRIVEKSYLCRPFWILQRGIDGVWTTLQQFPTLEAAVARKHEILNIWEVTL